MHVTLVNSNLALQAVGPIVGELEVAASFKISQAICTNESTVDASASASMDHNLSNTNLSIPPTVYWARSADTLSAYATNILRF